MIYDMIYMIYDMIYDIIYLLTAIGLSAGGRIMVYITKLTYLFVTSIKKRDVEIKNLSNLPYNMK